MACPNPNRAPTVGVGEPETTPNLQVDEFERLGIFSSKCYMQTTLVLARKPVLGLLRRIWWHWSWISLYQWAWKLRVPLSRAQSSNASRFGVREKGGVNAGPAAGAQMPVSVIWWDHIWDCCLCLCSKARHLLLPTSACPTCTNRRGQY